MARCFKIHQDDNVATLLDDGNGRITLVGSDSLIQLNEPIARGHKVALREILAGEPVVKYGVSIGHSTGEIRPGDWVHLHNLASAHDERSSTLELETGAPTDTLYE